MPAPGPCPPGHGSLRVFAGIDVFATARNAGWDLNGIPCKDREYGKIVHSRVHPVGLVLIE